MRIWGSEKVFKRVTYFMGVVALILTCNSEAKTTVLKIAATAPEGTTWAVAMDKMAKEVKEVSKGEVEFKMYYGGKAGDEASVIRQIRIGKMHGGVFTGKTLGEINGDVRVLEIPFNFTRDRAKAWDTLKKGENLFKEGFKSKNYRLLSFFEIGQVYLVSKKAVKNLKDLQGLKIWTWAGDDLSGSFIQSMNLVGVPLGLESVLNALSTGMIDMAYSSPLGILALQWQDSINYLVNFPVTFSLGAFVVHEKFWNQINPNLQKKVQEIVDKHSAWANQEIIGENQKALESLKKKGEITFIDLPEAEFSEAKKIREKVIAQLTGKLFSKKAVDFLVQELKNH